MTEIFERIAEATDYTMGIISYPDQEILIGTGWHDICKNFHRANPKTEKMCRRNNTLLTKGLNESKRYSFRECSQGIVDGAAPVIVRGKHIASLMLGQILMEEPDVKRFERQADKYGFDKDEYIKALNRVPIVSREKYVPMLLFLSELATMIAEQSLANLELIAKRNELEKEIAEKEAVLNELKKTEERFTRIVENARDMISRMSLPDGDYEYISPA